MIGVVRSPGAPKALLESTAEDRYRHPEVVRRLIEDFGGKCYICEINPLQDPEVEHLRPHKNGMIPGRKFDWNNLFLACRHCNGVKNQPKYENRVLDCCVRDPEELLDQGLSENSVCVRPLVENDVEVAGTAKLIEEVFTSSKPPLREHAAQVRLDGLQERMNLLYRAIQTLRSKPQDRMARRNLRAMLRKEAAFAGFTRCAVRKMLPRHPELGEFMQ